MTFPTWGDVRSAASDFVFDVREWSWATAWFNLGINTGIALFPEMRKRYVIHVAAHE